MNRDLFWQEIERLEKVLLVKRETLNSLKDTTNRISRLYQEEKKEAYDVLAIMQSIIFAYTIDTEDDEPTREDIFAKAELLLDEYSMTMKTGKNE